MDASEQLREMQNMQTTIRVILIVGVILIFAVIVNLFYYFNKRTVMRRRMRKAVYKNISQFLNGDVARIVGNVEFVGEPLLAPLSGRPCAYYHIYVEQHVQSSKISRWQKLIEEEVSGNFIIRDGRNGAFISGQKIQTYLVQDKTFHSGFLNDAASSMEQYLTQKGVKSVNFIGMNKTLRYREGILESGELVSVLGKGEWKEAHDLKLPESIGRILHITPSAEQPVYMSDDPETVKISEANTTYYTK